MRTRAGVGAVSRWGIAATLLIAVLGCERDQIDSTTGATANAAVSGEASVTLRIRPRGVYTVEGDGEAVAMSGLARRLQARRAVEEGAGTLQLLAYPGATGYDVVLATRAAREAGFRRIEGIADYSDLDTDHEKRWTQELLPEPVAHSTASDTPRRQTGAR